MLGWLKKIFRKKRKELSISIQHYHPTGWGPTSKGKYLSNGLHWHLTQFGPTSTEYDTLNHCHKIKSVDKDGNLIVSKTASRLPRKAD